MDASPCFARACVPVGVMCRGESYKQQVPLGHLVIGQGRQSELFGAAQHSLRPFRSFSQASYRTDCWIGTFEPRPPIATHFMSEKWGFFTVWGLQSGGRL